MTTGARAVEKLIQQYGCLPSACDGPVLHGFDARAMASALEQEIARAREYGWPKITIHLDIPDAARLAAQLRRP